MVEAAQPNILAVRALNSIRKLHIPTYVALRYLLNSVAGKNESSWYLNTVPRKLLLQKNSNFFVLQKYKKKKKNNTNEYREFITPGPLTALGESLVLDYLGKCEEFEKPNCVYSYRWPKSSDCPYSFEHYVNGYKQRNTEIALFLKKNPDKIIIISDIEKVYPSIDQKKVYQQFSEKLERSDVPIEIAKTASKLAHSMFDFFPDGIGIPTGPDLSHILGDLALSQIDEVLMKRYPGGYFRYVDDIVLLIDVSEKDSALRLLEDLAAEEGLKIHPGKTDILSSDEWLAHGPHITNKITHNTFEALTFQIKTFLLAYPSKSEKLKKSLTENGFSIPMGRLETTRRTAGFVERLVNLKRSGWKVAWNAIRANDEEVLLQALSVRENIKSQLERLTASNTPEGSTRRRWYIQRLRYAINRAVYVIPHVELHYIIEKIEPYEELSDSVALIIALAKKDMRDVMEMPGPALSACADLFRQTGRKLRLSPEEKMTDAFIESVGTLLLMSVSDLEQGFTAELEEPRSNFIDFCSGNNVTKRGLGDFGYLDEITSLQLNYTNKDAIHMLESRFSDDEHPVFDALSVGGDYDY